MNRYEFAEQIEATVSSTAARRARRGRRAPDPNVLVELGYALGTLGAKKVTAS